MMMSLAKNWLAAAFGWASRGISAGSHRLPPIKWSERHPALACEPLEGRVVLSDWGGGSSLLASLTYVGVVTSSVVASTETGNDEDWAASQSSTYQQLNTDRQALATEFQTLAAKSRVTIADLQSLATDTQAIAQAGFHFNSTTLQPVISELAMAVAGKSSTTQAQTDFTALFSSSSVSSTVITTTFNDLVKAIGDSAVTPTDLTNVATDQAAIKSDLSALSGGSSPRHGAGECLNSVDSSSVLVQAFGDSFGREGGGSLPASLTYVGVVTSPVVTSTQTGGADDGTAASQSSTYQQLNTDRQALATELQTLAAKSLVTVADVQSVATDKQAIAQAGFHFNSKTLQPVISELATAVAGNSATTQAQTDFTALFSSSSVSSTVMTTTFNDLVKVIGDSAVTPTDLTTVATDQAAIQTDLNNLHGSRTGGGCTEGSSSGSLTNITSSTIATSNTGSTSNSRSASGTTKVKIVVAQTHPTATRALKVKHTAARRHR
jgi:hypothetical protein